MKLVTIFDDRIWSVIYDDSIEDAFNDEFDKWHNAEYVYNYILENIDSKNNSPWRKYNAQELTVMVKKEAIMFESRLEEMYKNGFKDFDNEFVNLITGGAIKFVHEMKDSKDLTKELDKLRTVKEWLKENGIHISNDVETLTEE